MKYRILSWLVIIALAISLSGCPASGSIAYGVWIFTLESPPSPPESGIGRVILQNGFTQEPPAGYPGVVSVLGGTVVWQRVGSTITITQDTGSVVFTYTGTVQSPTSMSGTYAQVGDPSNSGSWSATLGPDS
jgi:hypothetical protein